MKQLDLPVPKFLQNRTNISVFDRFDACSSLPVSSKNKRGNVVGTIYANFKIFGGELNKFYKFEGV